jgi:hypothetical protein
MIRVLRDAGRKLYVHFVISGGEMLTDTLLGFETLARTPDKNVVVWINEYFGPVSRDGKALDQVTVFQAHTNKMLGSIGIPQRSPDTFGESIQLMRTKKLTFDEAIQSEEFMLVQKSRLYIVQRELFEQLDRLQLA